jgi:arylsulfatase A-like enzyme
MPSEVSRTDTSHIVGNIDLAPTILDVAGIEPPALVNGHPIDGDSLVPIIESPAAPWREDTLVEMRGACEENDPPPDDCTTRALQTNWNVSSVRSGQYIYGEYHNGDRELYNLTTDPFQLNNLCPASQNFACPGFETVQADMDARLDALTEP